MPYGVNNVNRVARSGQHLVASYNQYLIRTLLDITATGTPSDTSQKRFDLLVQFIAQRANPVIVGSVFTTSESGPISDLPAASGAGPYTVYHLRFAVERAYVWPGNDETELLNDLDTLGSAASYSAPFDFNYDGSGANENVSIKKEINF